MTLLQQKVFQYHKSFTMTPDLWEYPCNHPTTPRRRTLAILNIFIYFFYKQESRYDLVGVICHHGTAGGGHYTSYGLNNGDQEWYEYDDSYVSKVIFLFFNLSFY